MLKHDQLWNNVDAIYIRVQRPTSLTVITLAFNWTVNTHLLFFLLCNPRALTELLDMLFELDATFSEFDALLWCCIEFSLLPPRKLLLTITREAPSKRSFKLSPTMRNVGNRIQHVLTVHEPDIPWHLHSWRISAWTCCKWKEINCYSRGPIVAALLDIQSFLSGFQEVFKVFLKLKGW